VEVGGRGGERKGEKVDGEEGGWGGGGGGKRDGGGGGVEVGGNGLKSNIDII